MIEKPTNPKRPPGLLHRGLTIHKHFAKKLSTAARGSCHLITDKHTEILDYSKCWSWWCVMVILLYSASWALISNIDHSTQKKSRITVWPWPLTYVLDIQSKPSKGQGRLPCQKSRSKVKQECVNKPTNKQRKKGTDRQWQTHATKHITFLLCNRW